MTSVPACYPSVLNRQASPRRQKSTSTDRAIDGEDEEGGNLPEEAIEYLRALDGAGKRKRKQLMRDILDGRVAGLQPPVHPENDPNLPEQAPQLERSVVNVNRTSKQTRGGKVFSFGALAVAGNREDLVGYAYAKGSDPPSAISKAVAKAGHNLYYIPLARARTIFHPVEAEFEQSKVRLLPAARGVGLHTGRTLASVCKLAGIKDVMGKVVGSRNAINTVKAAFKALDQIETPTESAHRLGSHIYELDSFGRPIQQIA